MKCETDLLEVRVWGEFACFTRPEMKVERVSYPVITPSAARGVLEAIFWKPEFRWQVQEIWVLKPIRYFSLVRNEVSSRASEKSARTWATNGGGFDATADRAQRHTLGLRDVAYVVRASQRLKPGVDAHPAKYQEQFLRRVRAGRCFSTPYLGCREFSACFGEVRGDDRPLDITEDLGLMLLDVTYPADDRSRGIPRFFPARLESGILRVPQLTVEEGGAGAPTTLE